MVKDYWFNSGNRVRTEFRVNEEKRVVICQITAMDDMNVRLAKYNFYNYYPWGKVRTYRGIARCHPDDQWNETFGRRLAEYRATKLRVNDVNREIQKFISRLERDSLNLVRYGVMKQPRYPEMPEE